MDDILQRITVGTAIALVILTPVIAFIPKFFTAGLRATALAAASGLVGIISAWGIWILYPNRFSLSPLQEKMFFVSYYNAILYSALFLITLPNAIRTTYSRCAEWIKDDDARQATLDDIKMVFDGIKQLGLALTIAIGLKVFQEPMTQHLHPFITTLINGTYLIIVIYLLICGYLWIGFSFKSKPSSKWLHRLALVFFATYSLAMLYYIIWSAFKDIYLDI
ncbi:hypothetical protein ACCD10_16140 [Pseudomonas sp. Pseusp122]|uniref:hypothetical protein n=1 Tax=unclassified Pseudomonas TaxID=196821 RepID=UPI0039A46B86